MSESLVTSWYRSGGSAAFMARAGAVVALAGAAVVHATVIGEHLDEWFLAGAFFLVVTFVELFLAVAVVVAWSRRTAIAVVVTSVVTVVVWLLSRSVGLPIGPEEFRTAEAIGAPDISCCVLEIAAAALVAPWALRSSSQRRSATDGLHRRGTTVAVVLAGVLGAVALWGLTSSLGGTDDADHGHESMSVVVLGPQPQGPGTFGP